MQISWQKIAWDASKRVLEVIQPQIALLTHVSPLLQASSPRTAVRGKRYDLITVVSTPGMPGKPTSALVAHP